MLNSKVIINFGKMQRLLITINVMRDESLINITKQKKTLQI